jgi:hypothetical protein
MDRIQNLRGMRKRGMPKYKIEIEFEIDINLKFPADAILLDAMQAQLESLEDGTLEDELGTIWRVSNATGKVVMVEET